MVGKVHPDLQENRVHVDILDRWDQKVWMAFLAREENVGQWDQREDRAYPEYQGMRVHQVKKVTKENLGQLDFPVQMDREDIPAHRDHKVLEVLREIKVYRLL